MTRHRPTVGPLEADCGAVTVTDPPVRHHDRVTGDDGAEHVMADVVVIREAVAENPAWCNERWWGKRLAALTVDLGPADDVVVREVVAEAWRRKAPAHVVREHPDVG